MAAPEPITPSPAPAPTELPLRGDRTLTLLPVGRDDLVEVRAADGRLELRIRLTEDGPVLEMEAVRLELKAGEAVEIDTKDFRLRADGEVGIAADGDVRVTGEIIHLN